MSQYFRGPLPDAASIRPGGTGSRVRSPQITVLVGPYEEPFYVNKDVLCRSSVLAAMLIYPPEDWEQDTICLRDDLPEHVQYLFEYLLSNNYQTEMERDFEIGARSFEDVPELRDGDPVVWQHIVNRISKEELEEQNWPDWTSPEDSHRLRAWIADRIRSRTKPQRESQNSIDKRNAWKFQLALEHLDLYVLAERYDLEGLQKLACKKMIKHTDWRSSPTSVLDLAAAVYPYLPEGDNIFRPRIRKLFDAILEWISMEGIEECKKVYGHYVEYGGTFAEDLTAAYDPVVEDPGDQISSSTPSIMTSEEWHDAFAGYMPLCRQSWH